MQISQCEEALAQAKEEIEQLKKKLHDEMTHDYLTKVFNRQGLQEKCEYLIEMAKRDGSYLSVALIEIDDFDTLNSEHGRAKGDMILQDITKSLLKNTRKVDVVGRFDAHAFTILMPHTNKEHAIMVAERIRLYVQVYPIASLEGMSVSCGISTLGVSLYDDTQTIYDTLHLNADEALYHAKKKKEERAFHYDNLQEY